jgi:universal stress protein E
MRKVRQILVAVKDPYARVLPGIAKAAQVARACGARLELFHGMTTPIYIGDVQLPSETPTQHAQAERTRCLHRLESLAERLRQQGIEVTTSAEADYPAYEAIIRRARKIGADLIVADCHAGHVAPWLMQLTDWELLRHSPVPVLLVKNARRYRNPVVLAAIDPLHAFAKPGKLDAQILRAGERLKTAMRGTLHAMHAFYPAPPGASPAEILDPAIADELLKMAETRARKGFLRIVRGFEIPRGRQHLVAQHPFDAIQNVARKTRADIVVMGAISRSGLKRLFIGNTAERVLDELTCDVLIVKPSHFESRVQRSQRGARFLGRPLPPMPF